jgi:hypothetical protein
MGGVKPEVKFNINIEHVDVELLHVMLRVERVVRCFNLEFLGDWNGHTGAACVSHTNQCHCRPSKLFSYLWN